MYHVSTLEFLSAVALLFMVGAPFSNAVKLVQKVCATPLFHLFFSDASWDVAALPCRYTAGIRRIRRLLRTYSSTYDISPYPFSWPFHQ